MKMRRLGMLGVILLFVSAPAAMADISVTSSYFIADAETFSSLFGHDVDHNEAYPPVNAQASVGEQGKGAVASSFSNPFIIGALSAVVSEPQQLGLAQSSSRSLLGLTSDTPWLLDLEAAVSYDSSTNGSVGMAAKAFLFDIGGNQIYDYDLAVDGFTDSTIFGAGTYNLVLLGSSVAFTPDSQDNFEFAFSSVELNADLSVVPLPPAVILGGLGLTFSGWLLKRKRML